MIREWPTPRPAGADVDRATHSRRLAAIALALLWVGAPSPAAARFLFRYHHDRRFVARGHTAPNETEPAKSLTVLAHAGEGVYVSVGTERSFISAAVSPRVTHLLLIDYDARVVAFNRTNIALLQVARDRADYLRLRLSASRSEWIGALTQAQARVEPYLRPYLTEKKYFDSYRDALKERGFAPLNDPALAKKTGEFQYVNYLYDDVLFLRVAALAKAGRLQAETLDLTKLGEVAELVAELRERRLAISVLDLSNCWMDEYVPSPAFERALLELARGSSPAGLLVLTNLSPNYLSRRSQIQDPAFGFHSDYVWSYYGFPLPELTELAVATRFTASLKHPLEGREPSYVPGKVNSLATLRSSQ